jgi:hypothetical protein
LHPIRRTEQMATKKTTGRRRELELSRGAMKRRSLVIISAIIAVAAVLIAILSNTVLANHQPAIVSLGAEYEEVLPLETSQVSCHATDPDKDQLSYNWSVGGGTITGEGATVNWTAPLSTGPYDVTVTVIDGHGGNVTDHVTILVTGSRPPTIDSVVADADWTTPSGILQVTCNATDPDGDELSYEWSASGGSIDGTGAVVDWTAPEEVGTYHVTVVVKDGDGGEDIRSMYLSAATGSLPIIEDLIVTADHKYLKETDTGYKVGKTKEFQIECIALNISGELVYEWSCTEGQISGEGSTITWTAPDVSGEVTVTVIATDVADNSVTKSIILDVVSCSVCTFG